MARKGSPVPGTRPGWPPSKVVSIVQRGWAAGRGCLAQFRLHSVLMTVLPGDRRRKFHVPLSQKARSDKRGGLIGEWARQGWAGL